MKGERDDQNCSLQPNPIYTPSSLTPEHNFKQFLMDRAAQGGNNRDMEQEVIQSMNFIYFPLIVYMVPCSTLNISNSLGNMEIAIRPEDKQTL